MLRLPQRYSGTSGYGSNQRISHRSRRQMWWSRKRMSRSICALTWHWLQEAESTDNKRLPVIQLRKSWLINKKLTNVWNMPFLILRWEKDHLPPWGETSLIFHSCWQLSCLEFPNSILYRGRQVGSPSYQLVLPAELCSMVVTSLHDHMEHMGVDCTLDLLRTRFYWPRMALDVERKVKTCGRCVWVCRKALPETAAPLVNVNTTGPLEMVCMDFLSLEPDKSGAKDILVITDHFTKFAVAIPAPNQKAHTVAKCLQDNFIVN